MKKSVGIVGMCLLMAGCGGGGSSSPATPQPAGITYFVANGLTWSSPSAATYGFDGPSVPFAESANYYCSGAVSVGGGAQVADNFNKQTGWSLPTLEQLRALHRANSTPPGWGQTSVWYWGGWMEFPVGTVGIGNGGRHKVVCVKNST